MSYKTSSYYNTEEKVKLAGDDSKDKLYEPKTNQKAIKVLTVAAYVLCVSLAAIMLSLYYIFLWDPTKIKLTTRDKGIPDSIANRLINATDVSIDSFCKEFAKRIKKEKNENSNRVIEVKQLNIPPGMEQIFGKSQQYSTDTQENSKMENLRRDREEVEVEDDDSDNESADYETSGQNELTTNSNDTTIIFDQDDIN